MVSCLYKKNKQGNYVHIKHFPYQVSVRIDDKHVCSGSILNNFTVLTAARCVYKKTDSKFSVRIGNCKESEGHPMNVSRIIEHQNYNSTTRANNLAILKFSSSLPLYGTSKSIAFGLPEVKTVTGTTATIAGWGSEFGHDDNFQSHLRAVNTKVINENDCAQIYKNFSQKVSSHTFCATTIESGFCVEDYGGPFVVDKHLIGVASWGYGCGMLHYPNVYTNVSDMHTWISSHL